MLSKPDAGWTTVKIGHFKGYASYTWDVPVDCLNAAIDFLKGKKKIIDICFDEEGPGIFYVKSGIHYTRIFYEYDSYSKKVNIGALELSKEIAADIREYFELWVKDWDMGADFEARRQILKDKVELLEKLIEIWDREFNKAKD